MRKYTIQLLTLAIYTTALAVGPVVISAKAETSSKHIKKHMQTRHMQTSFATGNHVQRRRAQDSFGFSDTTPAGPINGGCPGSGRSFECATWPPPMYDDPDRKVGGSDGG
jgi:hypothetical protein